MAILLLPPEHSDPSEPLLPETVAGKQSFESAVNVGQFARRYVPAEAGSTAGGKKPAAQELDEKC